MCLQIFAKLFGFSLLNANAFFKKNKGCVNNKIQTRFSKFLYYLDLYLDLLDDFTITLLDKIQINIYELVTLENGTIMCATSNFHNKV